MRDWVRRMLGIVPPIDTSDPDAQVGDTPIQQPYPSNSLINQVIGSTADWVNTEVGLVTDSAIRSISVSAQTADGPYRVDLGTLADDPYGVREAWWNNGTNDLHLTPTSFAELDRRGFIWPDEGVSTPQYLVVEPGSIFIHPAPSAAGTLKLRCANGICGPVSDSDGFKNLPHALVTHMLYNVIVELAATLADDAGMAARAQAFAGRAQVGLSAIGRHIAGFNEQHQPGIVPEPYRRVGR